MFKRALAGALAACMTIGLMITGAGAFSYSSEAEDWGKLLHRVYDAATGGSAYYVTQVAAVGSVIEFDETVSAAIAAEDENGSFITRPVQSGCTRFTIPDANHTYVFTGSDGAAALVRGSGTRQIPITLVGDMEGASTTTMALSKPVVDVTVEALQVYDYQSEKYVISNYIVYEVSAGTTIEAVFGEGAKTMMLTDIWKSNGKLVEGDAFTKLSAKQFPAAEVSEVTGAAMLPVTLNEVGYYYCFLPEGEACSFPIFKVVDEELDYTPRTPGFTDMNWSKSFVEKAYSYGWMEGMGGGKFQPDGNLTIAQAITLAARIHSAKTNCAIPVSEGAWYQSYVDYCVDNRLLYNFVNYGQESKILTRINEKATRMEMVKILSVAASLPGLSRGETETVNVPDVDRNASGGELVYNWYRAGIVSGKDAAGSFKPNDNITRGEVAVILCNLLGL